MFKSPTPHPSGLLLVLLLSFLFVASISANDNGFPRCNCDEDEGLWSIDSILECQRVGDFLIAVAYFSIPIELLYFISCSNIPFKWVLVEFIAFIVLCGMTHLLNGWTYGPHTFQLMVAVTVFKILTALVSCATAITLFSLIPLLLKVKVREFMLKKKTWDLGREVGMIMRQREAGLHVRMLTQEIRKSLDRHTILYTTLVELSKTLGLQNCAVWMPNEMRTEMHLTHELNGGDYSNTEGYVIPTSDPDVARIKGSGAVNILRPDSPLAAASTSTSTSANTSTPVAAIRMPILRVCNFKGGTPEMIQACYAVLVLVLPGGENEIRGWSNQELEIIKVVADQVAVALSHAAVLEESQIMREKLEEQNRALQQAKMDAMMASKARNAFQKVMSDGMKRPMHSVLGLVSMLQDESLDTEQKIIVDTMMKANNVLSILIDDVMGISTAKGSGRFPVETNSFGLHSMITEAACLAKCLCVYKGFGFGMEVDRSLPDNVMGDERRIFQVILHMVGNLLDGNSRGGSVLFRVVIDHGSQERNDQRWGVWRQSSSDGRVCIRFEIGLTSAGSEPEASGSAMQLGGRRYTSDGFEQGLSFTVCKKLVQMMQGNIWVFPNNQGFVQNMGLVLRFQLRQSMAITISEPGESSEHHQHPPHSNSFCAGLQVVLVESDDLNRTVTRRLLEKLGCSVTALSSGYDCLNAICQVSSAFQVVLLDLQLPDLDGFEVAAKIRKFRSRSWPVILAMTSSGGEEDDLWEKCVQMGMNGVIRKPILLQGIANELRRVVLQANRAV
ncbi:Ethylene receptor 2 [Linum grandiflorum]